MVLLKLFTIVVVYIKTAVFDVYERVVGLNHKSPSTVRLLFNVEGATVVYQPFFPDNTVSEIYTK